MKVGVKQLWVMLAASVALNLFCFGWFAARSSLPLRSRMQHEAGGPRSFLRRSGLRDAGPDVQAIIKRQRSELHEQARTLGEARQHARDALSAEPFDPERLQQGFGEVRAQTTSMQAAMHKALVEVAGKLSAEQRKRLADALWRRRGDHPEPPAL